MTNKAKANIADFEHLALCKVMADRDFMNGPKKGRKRTIKIAKGTVMECAAVFLNRHEEPVAKVYLADGKAEFVNPNGLSVKAKLDKKAAAALEAAEAEANADREAGRKLVALVADSYEPATAKTSFLRFGEHGGLVPSSVVNASKAGGGKIAVVLPVWVITSKFSAIADSLLKVAKPVNKAK